MSSDARSELKAFDFEGLAFALRGQRFKRGLTQEDVARETCQSVSTICRIEKICSDLSIATVVAVCEWLEQPVDTFVRSKPPAGTQ